MGIPITSSDTDRFRPPRIAHRFLGERWDKGHQRFEVLETEIEPLSIPNSVLPTAVPDLLAATEPRRVQVNREQDKKALKYLLTSLQVLQHRDPEIPPPKSTVWLVLLGTSLDCLKPTDLYSTLPKSVDVDATLDGLGLNAPQRKAACQESSSVEAVGWTSRDSCT
jgi:hypothetical protein